MGRDGRALRVVIILVLPSLFACGIPPLATERADGGPWNDFRGGAGNPGGRDLVLIPEGFAPALERSILLHSGVTSPVTGGGGRLYAGTRNGTLFCIDHVDGRIVWSRELSGMIEAAPMLLSNGSGVVCATSEGTVAMMSSTSGKVIWSFRTPTGGRVFSSPKELSGLIYFGSYDSTFYCLHAVNGTLAWSYPGCDGWIHTTPALSSVDYRSVVLFGACDGTMNCLDAETGDIVWRFRTAYIPSSPSISGGRVFFGCYDRKLFCLDLNDGSEVWNISLPKDVYSSPAVMGERVAVGCNDGALYMLNGSDGAVLWSREMSRDALESSPLLFEDIVAVTTRDGLFLLDVINGTLRNGFELGDASDTSPTYLDGRLVFGDSYGWVRTIAIERSKENGGDDDREGMGKLAVPIVLAVLISAAVIGTTTFLVIKASKKGD